MSVPVTMLARAEAYLAERRRLRFVLDRSGSLTRAFARFVDASGHEGPLTSAIVLRWAKEQAMHADPFTWAQRLNVLRPFARHLADAESGTAFPERRALRAFEAPRVATHLHAGRSGQDHCSRACPSACVRCRSSLASNSTWPARRYGPPHLRGVESPVWQPR